MNETNFNKTSESSDRFCRRENVIIPDRALVVKWAARNCCERTLEVSGAGNEPYGFLAAARAAPIRLGRDEVDSCGGLEERRALVAKPRGTDKDFSLNKERRTSSDWHLAIEELRRLRRCSHRSYGGS